MSRHTPGPWKFETGDGRRYVIETVDDGIPIVWEMGGIDSEADARLIAVSPRLFAILDEIVRLGLLAANPTIRAEAVAALNDARGGA
jgi:hypothetical protein